MINHTKTSVFKLSHQATLDQALVALGPRIIVRPQLEKFIGVPTFTLFRFSFTRPHIPCFNTGRALGDTEDVFHRRTRSRFLARPRDSLWVHVSCNTMQEHATVRRWCRRRIEVALRENLKERGLNWEGKVIGGGGEGDTHELRGSLHFNGTRKLVTADWTEVKREIGLAVTHVVTTCEQIDGQEEQTKPEPKRKGNKKANMSKKSKK